MAPLLSPFACPTPPLPLLLPELPGCYLQLQIQPFGGLHSEFYRQGLATKDITAFSWRDTTMTTGMDCFHLPDRVGFHPIKTTKRMLKWTASWLLPRAWNAIVLIVKAICAAIAKAVSVHLSRKKTPSKVLALQWQHGNDESFNKFRASNTRWLWATFLQAGESKSMDDVKSSYFTPAQYRISSLFPFRLVSKSGAGVRNR